MENNLFELGEKVLFEVDGVDAYKVPGVVLRRVIEADEYVILDENGELHLTHRLLMSSLEREIVDVEYSYASAEIITKSKVIALMAEPHQDECLIKSLDGKKYLSNIWLI
jgi:hypothetical protein